MVVSALDEMARSARLLNAICSKPRSRFVLTDGACSTSPAPIAPSLTTKTTSRLAGDTGGAKAKDCSCCLGLTTKD